MSRITENIIEEFCIELLEKQGYETIYAPDIAPDSDNPQRSSFEDVLLSSRLTDAVARINPTIPHDAQQEAIKEISRIHSPELLTNNERFHRMLTEGVKVSYQKNGSQRGDLVWLVDFANPENNDFVVANQLTVIENGVNKRPDVVLFVNGLPLVVIELKNAADENASAKSAYKQLQTYKATIPSLFTYNGLMIISDGLEAKAGSLSAGLSRYLVPTLLRRNAYGKLSIGDIQCYGLYRAVRFVVGVYTMVSQVCIPTQSVGTSDKDIHMPDGCVAS